MAMAPDNGSAWRRELETVAARLETDFALRFGTLGVDISVWGGVLSPKFAGVAVEYSLPSEWSRRGGSPYWEVAQRTRAGYLRPWRPIRTVDEVEAEMRRHLDDWLKTRPWEKPHEPGELVHIDRCR
jgi:hypothetical protein